MSTGIDIQLVKDTYQRMSDDDLIRVTTQDAHGLTPEAREVVIAEIKKRGLNLQIAESIEAQNRTYTFEEIDQYCNLLSSLPCPVCGSSSTRLNATMVMEVMSFLFFTQLTRKLKVACPTCLDKANNTALMKTAVLGWWGVPWGIIRSIQSITLNMNALKTNHLDEHNDFLRGYTLAKIGELEAYKETKEKLQQVISGD